MRIRVLFAALLAFTGNLAAQQMEYVYRDEGDSSRNCYLKIIPAGEIKALVVRDFSSLPDTSKDATGFHSLCAKQGIMTVFTVSSKGFPDLAIDPEVLNLLDELVCEVVAEHHIDPKKVFIGGMSASGARALLYTEYCAQHKSKGGIQIAGAFAADSPLDYERLWYEARNAVARNYESNALAEGKLLLNYFEKEIGGGPDELQYKYQSQSPFCYTAPIPGNEQYLLHTPLRLYIEPDIEWWIENKRKDYYDINAVDAAALVNRLKIQGGKKAELIVTQNQGYLRNGKRHPHAWSIVDQDKLLAWMLDILK